MKNNKIVAIINYTVKVQAISTFLTESSVHLHYIPVRNIGAGGGRKKHVYIKNRELSLFNKKELIFCHLGPIIIL